MDQKIIVYSSPEELAEKFAEVLYSKITSLIEIRNRISIVLSGGSTPKLLFKTISDKYAQKIKWECVEIFWSDERCVPANHPESNFGMTKHVLLDYISIPKKNIHRIMGENNPSAEAERYSLEILTHTELRNNLPYFDIVLLGLGEDGHTASIFPDQMQLLNSDKICDTAVHPVTKQNRITITGKVINNSGNIVFLVSGKSKADIIKKIINNWEDAESYPAMHIHSYEGETEWFLDKDASGKLVD